MAKRSPTIYARTSIAVVAFFTIAWSWPAFSQEPVPLAKDLSKGGPYPVFLSQNRRKEHQAAIIAVVQTGTGSGDAYGLVFLQTKGDGHIGQGIVCQTATERPDSALECNQTVGGRTETLRVAAIGSTFCNKLRDDIEQCVKDDETKKEYLYTSPSGTSSEGENPVASRDRCNKCVCFEISHGGEVCSLGKSFPPNSGTGTGGHN